ARRRRRAGDGRAGGDGPLSRHDGGRAGQRRAGDPIARFEASVLSAVRPGSARPTAVALLLACGPALTLAGPSIVRASEPEMFGMGGRGAAMAGTGVADAEGYDATYTNPAGVVGP